ncbi:IPExxxVDY family protein [Robiginitalea sp. M39]|uniref:IPExxxVDY family protein n=2 Tax=Robiginitalea aurantiaca TaxID=3056915 RepID=A0ABT7WE79_9FLAO|nr:IPExxxVDY family protein [Robiginitalea aurantiaca]
MEDLWEDLLDETVFSLFAIHSNLEDYAMAYAINAAFGLHLKRTREDLELNAHGLFVVFEWKDETAYREWTLFKNSGSEYGAGSSTGLFKDEPEVKRRSLIPEKREVDFFLKLEGDEQNLGILPSLLSIPRVSTAYRLETAKLKSRYNLIY